MKKYITNFTVLLLFSSCIKVETVNICPNAPPAPALAFQNIQLGFQDTLNLSVLAPNPSLTYVWVGPTFQIPGASISLTPVGGVSYYGTWSVIAQTATCSSDTTKFTVTPGITTCGLGRDSFQLSGTAASKFYFFSSQNSTFNGYYQISFQDNNGDYFYIYFQNQPTTSSVYSVSNYSYSNLNYNQCYLSYQTAGGLSYAGYNGNVSVIVSGSAITVTFCSIGFNNGSGYTVNGSGYFIGS
jgi:hypothetical protein